MAGESDTAELWLGGYDFGLYAPPSRRGISSQPTTEETVTSTETLTAQPKPFYSTASNPPRVDWAIATRGVDSYDVAEVTVRYSYLTPPSS